VDWEWWQKQWDAQQETYMPDREERLEAMLDVVESVCGAAPRVLDLAGGTGSITRRVLARWSGSSSVIVDVDPALLKIASGTFAGDDRVRVCAADLAGPSWVTTLGEPPASFDAALTATALHWLTEDRVAGVYREVSGLLRAGGLFANADHMPDPGLAGPIGDAIDEFATQRTLRVRAESGADDWEGWWRRLAAEPSLADEVAQRQARFADRAGASHTESNLSSAWHTDALRAGGFAQAGLVWRGLGDAVVVGVRPAAL
jgi:SAM-dependent methyltransferase